MKNQNINIFTKGFRIHLIEKPKPDEEIMFEIDNYQVTRKEKYRFFKENDELRMKREGVFYKIKVDRNTEDVTLPST